LYVNDQTEGVKIERDILEKFNHPYIMRLHYAFQDPKNLYLVMEFVNGGELYYHIRI